MRLLPSAFCAISLHGKLDKRHVFMARGSGEHPHTGSMRVVVDGRTCRLCVVKREGSSYPLELAAHTVKLTGT